MRTLFKMEERTHEERRLITSSLLFHSPAVLPCMMYVTLWYLLPAELWLFWYFMNMSSIINHERKLQPVLAPPPITTSDYGWKTKLKKRSLTHDSHTNVLHFFGATKRLHLDVQVLFIIQLDADAERTGSEGLCVLSGPPVKSLKWAVWILSNFKQAVCCICIITRVNLKPFSKQFAAVFLSQLCLAARVWQVIR